MTTWTRRGRWPGVRRGMQRGPGAPHNFLSTANFTFANGLTGWTFGKPGTHVTDDGVDDLFSADVAVATVTDDFSSVAISPSATALPGQVWTGSLWIKSGSPVFLFQFLDAGLAQLAAVFGASTGETANGFTRYQASDTAPANTAWIRLNAYNNHDTNLMRIDAAALWRS